jgi:hypothetical protein
VTRVPWLVLVIVGGCGSDAVVRPPDARPATADARAGDAALPVDGGGSDAAPPAADARADAAPTPPPDAAAAPDAPLPDAAPPPPDARPPDAPSPPDAVSLLPDAPESKDAGANTAPTIGSVSWTAPEPCSVGVPGTFTIVVQASDAETPGMLTYEGSVSSCSGSIDGPDDSVTCPNVSPYVGQVTVTDPDGLFDRVFFTIEPCESGSM